MKAGNRILKVVCLMLAIGGTTIATQAEHTNPKEVTFKATDGITLWADIYLTRKGKSAPLIMLFHQGDGDARGEYGPLIPRLLKEGLNVIAVDLRTGGNLFGSVNRTVKNLKGQEYSYCDAYKDLEATLRFARQEGFSGKRLAWGSSYSATLAVRLGSDHPNDLAGILAFSPAGGTAMEACKVDSYLPKLKLPVLALRPASEMERESAKQQFMLFRKFGKQTYVADNGVHGSSMLSPSRVKGDVEEHWKMVLAFINGAVARK